tara:strand:+ start:304 stop:846 length:543 start_codon:yes stop_codon:yes gene_type:complete
MLPQMKTLTQFKTALKAPMYQELTLRELMLYKTGFKNGYRMALQHNRNKIDHQLFKLKVRQERFEEKTEGIKLERSIKIKKIYPMSFDAVVNKVCIRYEVNKQEVLGDRRFESLVRARSIIINLMIEKYAISLSQLGRLLKMDHTTIIHHRRMKSNALRFWSANKTIHEEFLELKDQLGV